MEENQEEKSDLSPSHSPLYKIVMSPSWEKVKFPRYIDQLVI